MEMPLLFLSPSTQEFNPYVTTGNEEYWMNQLADRMEPYLLASGVEMEGWSVEDKGESICFCVFVYNSQPGIEIDYSTGNSWEE